jgi:hypothetical protein
MIHIYVLTVIHVVTVSTVEVSLTHNVCDIVCNYIVHEDEKWL